jgi:hypothetical protein
MRPKHAAVERDNKTDYINHTSADFNLFNYILIYFTVVWTAPVLRFYNTTRCKHIKIRYIALKQGQGRNTVSQAT